MDVQKPVCTRLHHHNQRRPSHSEPCRHLDLMMTRGYNDARPHSKENRSEQVSPPVGDGCHWWHSSKRATIIGESVRGALSTIGG